MAQSLHDGEEAQASSQREIETPPGGADGASPANREGEGAGGEGLLGDAENEGTVEASGDIATTSDSVEPTREEIERELETLSRGPFKRILKDFLGFAPTAQAMKNFANKHPDKWANSLNILAQLAGYQKDVVVTNNIAIIGHMDDSALIRRMQELEDKLGVSHNMIGNTPSPTLRELSPSRDENIIDVKAKEKSRNERNSP